MTDTASNEFDIEQLIVGHFDGTLNEDQEKELATELTTSGEAKQLFLSHMRMEGRLHSLGRDGFLREPVANPTVQPERSGRQSTDNASSIRRVRKPLSLFAASTLAASSAVVLMLLSGVLWPSPVNASSVLQRAQQAAAEPVDRTYRVTVSHEGERSAVRELCVNVRGGGHFVLRPIDNTYVTGSDGTDYWLAQHDGPVWVTSQRNRLVPKLRRTMNNAWLFGIATNPKEPLLLEMAGLLSLMETRDVVLLESPSASEYHVRGTLRSGRPNGPEQVDFWADTDSGVGLRAQVRWSDGRQMQFELLDSVQLSDHWYQYSEHAPGREVKRL